MLPAKVGSIWPSSFRGEDVLTVANQKQVLVSDWLMLKNSSPLKLLGQIKPNLAGSIYVRSSKLNRVSYIDASCQVWFHLAKQFQGRRFVQH
jgi:hypothetical protein